MDGRFGGSPIREEQAAPTGELRPAAPSSPSHKRSRRSLQKRVVTIPIGGGEDGSRAKGAAGDGAPPSDSWAWRKYGQKPIKGSPYPRGYYRCSSSKGCPARKQVERSRVDPTMLLVTYSCDHNHPWPLPKNHHHHHHHQNNSNSNSNAADTKQLSPPAEEEPAPAAPAQLSPPEMAADRDERFADLIGEEDSTLMLAGEFGWLSADVGSPSSATEIICGPIFGGGGGSRMFPEESEKLSGSGEDEEEDSLFAGLGELPECSAVFRRSLAVTAAASSW